MKDESFGGVSRKMRGVRAWVLDGSRLGPLNLLTWSAPISNDAVALEFSQLVKANDPLRTGTYAKPLTFTLSTTTP